MNNTANLKSEGAAESSASSKDVWEDGKKD